MPSEVLCPRAITAIGHLPPTCYTPSTVTITSLHHQPSSSASITKLSSYLRSCILYRQPRSPGSDTLLGLDHQAGSLASLHQPPTHLTMTFPLPVAELEVLMRPSGRPAGDRTGYVQYTIDHQRPWPSLGSPVCRAPTPPPPAPPRRPSPPSAVSPVGDLLRHPRRKRRPSQTSSVQDLVRHPVADVTLSVTAVADTGGRGCHVLFTSC